MLNAAPRARSRPGRKENGAASCGKQGVFRDPTAGRALGIANRDCLMPIHGLEQGQKKYNA
jgi:hypothetical protein